MSNVLRDTFDRLRADGAQRLEPVRFSQLQVLSQRLDGQPACVRRLLEDKLAAGLQRLADDLAARRAAPREGKLHSPSAPPALLSLNEHIRSATQGQHRDELASVRRFRQSWSRIAMQDRVARAASRHPTNAGPLNSHLLVLQSLALMQELSGDYLRRFVAQAEALQWLEDAATQQASDAATAAKSRLRASRKKT